MTAPAPAAGSFARRIYDRCHLTGEFGLRSGASSDEYFDKYLFESDPKLLREIARALVQLLPEQVDAVAGLELGGVPLATVVSQLSGLPALFVRKQAKTYGTCRLAEGGEVAGRRLVVIEDVITTGGQAVASCRALRERGAEIVAVLCVLDRESGGATNIAGNRPWPPLVSRKGSLYGQTIPRRAAGPGLLRAFGIGGSERFEVPAHWEFGEAGLLVSLPRRSMPGVGAGFHHRQRHAVVLDPVHRNAVRATPTPRRW